jgi:hypothetical protein
MLFGAYKKSPKKKGGGRGQETRQSKRRKKSQRSEIWRVGGGTNYLSCGEGKGDKGEE